MKFWFLFVFLVLSYSYAHNSISGGEFVFEKEWTLQTENASQVHTIVLKVAEIPSNNVQKVEVDFNRPYFIEDGFYIIRVTDPSSTEKIKMIANIKTDYDNWDIKHPILKKDYEDLDAERSGALAVPNQEIKQFSQTFDQENVFSSTVAITEWVYKNVEYDEEYTEHKMPATYVFHNKKGTCDEFSHLSIAMFRSIGIPSRFVKGYVFSNNTWEFHAWTEYYNLEYGWLPVDPTFGEYIYLSGNRIILSSSDEQDDAFTDSVSAEGYGDFDISFTSSVNIEKIKTNDRKIYFVVSHDVTKYDSYFEIKILLENQENKFYFIPTTLVLPIEVGGHQKGITVLAPYEKKVLLRKADIMELNQGNYKVPYNLNMFGFEYNGNFEVNNHPVIFNNDEFIVGEMSKYWWILLFPILFILINAFTKSRKK
ncbi:transglutaminase-like domain-containing protein [Candidatus Micrarchaeota archaeon]|nr:transglutaminase-like domain-containing protein [Candidatus Micrarchaeota archaeon]